MIAVILDRARAGHHFRRTVPTLKLTLDASGSSFCWADCPSLTTIESHARCQSSTRPREQSRSGLPQRRRAWMTSDADVPHPCCNRAITPDGLDVLHTHKPFRKAWPVDRLTAPAVPAYCVVASRK